MRTCHGQDSAVNVYLINTMPEENLLKFNSRFLPEER